MLELEVKERPILFAGPMVRAILDGRKTQTRRLVTHKQIDVQKAEWVEPYANALGFRNCWSFMREIDPNHPAHGQRLACNSVAIDTIRCPYGLPGDRLWVRETWATLACYDHCKPSKLSINAGPWYYRADGEDYPFEVERWRPSIFMPRLACRLVLEITEVRVERLQSISEADKLAEGATPEMPLGTVWRKLHTRPGERFEDDPWAWAITFRRIEQETTIR